jgi:predicted adenylyl cyclase CyaB
MPTNIEIKARVPDFSSLKARTEQISDTPPTIIPQHDTFFQVPQGRLKLRVLAPDHGELIYYERADATGPKGSHYLVARTHDPAALENVLVSALGKRGVVKKRRLLYMVGNTRVHLDQVEGLGDFMELEVVLSPHQSETQGKATADALMERLGIQKSDLIDVAYIDLIEMRERRSSQA